jgi:hypothetical protein
VLTRICMYLEAISRLGPDGNSIWAGVPRPRASPDVLG